MMTTTSTTDMTDGVSVLIGTREMRMEKAISEAPESAKNTLREAFSGSASPRRAIKAMCLTCVGYDRQEIKNCSAHGCPLWKYRPFQERV
jgi:hypothetical protein